MTDDAHEVEGVRQRSHLPVTIFAWVAKHLISVTYGDGTTPAYNHTHEAVG